MKSFRFHLESRAELLQTALGLLIALGIIAFLYLLPISSHLLQTILLLITAVITGYLTREYPSRAFRRRYPNARAIPLLTLAIALCTATAVLQFLLKSPTYLLLLILPAIACIAAFLVINRRDPDVMK